MPVEVIGSMSALEIGSAVVGTVGAAHGMVPQGDSGFLFSSGEATYPTEQSDKFGQFVADHNYVNKVAVRFLAQGWFWDTDIDIAMRGYFSQDSAELVCFEDSDPDVPANRFMKDVGFYPAVGTDRVTSSLLQVTVDPDSSVAGSAEDPYLIWHVRGHFDPVGFGDAGFEFRLFIDSWAHVSIGDVNAPGLDVACIDDVVYLTFGKVDPDEFAGTAVSGAVEAVHRAVESATFPHR